MVKFCPVCHTKNAGGNSLCYGCGFNLIYRSSYLDSLPARRKTTLTVETLLFSLLNLLIVGGVYWAFRTFLI